MLINNRGQERVKAEGVVYYSVAFQEDEPQKHHEKYEGQIVDISPDGICISTRHEFELGSKVQFSITKYYKGIYTGIVRRCVRYSDDKCHVGLEVSFK